MPNETVIEKQTMIARAVLRREISGGRYRYQRREFPGGRFGRGGDGGERRQRAADHVRAENSYRGCGIEKLIPRAQDLATFLKLLGRSATGQPLTVYTSFLSGPRRAGEIDGPDEFYVVLLDNGRTKLLADRGETAVAVLHSLRRVFEPLPGVSQDRRAQLSVGLFGPDRRDYHAAVSWRGGEIPGCRSHPACAGRARKSVR